MLFILYWRYLLEEKIAGTTRSEPNPWRNYRSGIEHGSPGNQVTYIAGGSTGWSTTSARTAKTNLGPVGSEAILDGVTDTEVTTWEYADEDGNGRGVRHIGPMARDFHEAIRVGDSDDHINSINADGAALAAIQGLAQRHEAETADLRETLAAKDDRISELEAENERLHERLGVVEERLAGLESGDSSTAAVDD